MRLEAMSRRIMVPAHLASCASPSLIPVPPLTHRSAFIPHVATNAEQKQQRGLGKLADRCGDCISCTRVVAGGATLVVEDKLRSGLVGDLPTNLLLHQSPFVSC